MTASRGLVRCFTSPRAESSTVPQELNWLYGIAGAERLATRRGSLMTANFEAGW
jgi:hypothetical protein